jgi:hypothetical protein
MKSKKIKIWFYLSYETLHYNDNIANSEAVNIFVWTETSRYPLVDYF